MVDYTARMPYNNAMIIERKELDKLLHSDVLTVTFTKKDGTERVMTCTLQKELLPPLVEAKEGDVPKKEKNVSEAVMPVYDLKAKAFRSFRLDSIKQITSATQQDG